ncbi:MAG: hypothetical protein P9L94_18545 [Candidatus Hinthialibacter antarcticus]|nr:hypothetical protein [Candidatus Hinthialibacter antarcticus]
MVQICTVCHRVNVDGKWINGVPPIGKVYPTICPDCTEGGEETASDDSNRMAISQNKWAQKK